MVPWYCQTLICSPVTLYRERVRRNVSSSGVVIDDDVSVSI
jgi:hypothetical protein